MEEVLLGSDARKEAAINEASRTRGGIIGQERRQGLAVEHESGSVALQLDLTQEAWDLHAVHLKQTTTRTSFDLHQKYIQILYKSGASIFGGKKQIKSINRACNQFLLCHIMSTIDNIW